MSERITRTVEWCTSPAWGLQDCETCGMAYEDLTIEYDGKHFQARANWGCYDGAAKYNTDLAGVLRFLDELPDGFLTAHTRAELERQIEEEA